MTTAKTLTLRDFLLTRIAEDEAAADQVHRTGPDECDVVFHAKVDPLFGWECTCGLPARVLAECDAKRQMLVIHRLGCIGTPTPDDTCFGCGEYSPCESLRALASVYADHPHYRAE